VEAPPLVDAVEVGALRWVRYHELLRNLVLKDLKLKYRGSVLGFLWSLINPVMMIAVYTLAFTYIMKVRTENFVFFMLIGILAWSFFATAVGMSAGSVADNGSLVKSVYFPRAILPVASVIFNLAQYLMTIAVLLPVMMLLYRVAPATPMLAFPLFVALQTVFTIGVALAIAAGTVFFRDIRHLLEIALSLLFWLTPIIYELSLVPGRFAAIVQWGPMAPFILAYQHMFYYRQWPGPEQWIGAVVYAIVAFTAGSFIFARLEDRFTEQV
jgi:ABC-type polysaccharide/polyol phosphate export permease